MDIPDALKLAFFMCWLHLLGKMLRSKRAEALRVSPNSGVLQLDAYGRPIHLAEPGYTWSISSPLQGYEALGASLPGSPSVTIPGSQEPNLHYGTLQLKNGTVLDRPPIPPAFPAAEPMPGNIPFWLDAALRPACMAATAQELVAAPPATKVESSATGAFAPLSMPPISGGQVGPPGLPPTSPPSFPMQPLAVAAPPVCKCKYRMEPSLGWVTVFWALVDVSTGATAAGAQIGGLLGSLQETGVDPLQLPGFSLPMLNLHLPWMLKVRRAVMRMLGQRRIVICSKRW